MKTNIEITEKKTYSSPQIERIKLDNEISLVLESTDPAGEPGGGGWVMNAPEHFNNDPFKTNLG